MPADLSTMLRVSNEHDATVGIADRDLPQMEPRYHEIAAIADKLWAQIKDQFSADISTSEFADRLVKSRIRSVLMEVAHTATVAACDAALKVRQ